VATNSPPVRSCWLSGIWRVIRCFHGVQGRWLFQDCCDQSPQARWSSEVQSRSEDPTEPQRGPEYYWPYWYRPKPDNPRIFLCLRVYPRNVLSGVIRKRFANGCRVLSRSADRDARPAMCPRARNHASRCQGAQHSLWPTPQEASPHRLGPGRVLSSEAAMQCPRCLPQFQADRIARWLSVRRLQRGHLELWCY